MVYCGEMRARGVALMANINGTVGDGTNNGLGGIDDRDGQRGKDVDGLQHG